MIKHAWSLRLSIIATALSGAEIVVSIFSSDPPIPRGTFAILVFVVTMASGGARLVAQAKVSGPDAGGTA